MKKKILSLALLVGLLASGTMTANATESADIGHTSTGGTVEYTSAGKISDDLGNNINDMISAMQPGDTVTVSVDLKNSNSASAHWYMKNSIAKSMEAQDAQGGAYTYNLSYVDPAGETITLYDSIAVGGDDSKGLAAVDSMLSEESDYFYLGEVASGRSGKVQLTVGLDGETLGNAYQTKMAVLSMSFAVEPQPAGSTQYRTVKRQVVNDEVIYVDEDGVPLADGGTGTGLVKTGDESDLFPYVLAACLSGVLLMIVVFFGVKDRKKEEEGGALA